MDLLSACHERGNTRSKAWPKEIRGRQFGLWLSLVERLVRDQEAVGSNPTSPIIFIRYGFSSKFRNLRESDRFQIHHRALQFETPDHECSLASEEKV